jgi:glycosyltransferase involved in cell wall biosynthesis
MSKIKQINFQSPITYTGYGVAGYNLLVSMMENNTDVSLFPIGQPLAINPEKSGLIEKSLKNRLSYNHKAPSIKMWHAWDLASRVGSGDYYVFPFFELDTLNEIEQHNFKCCDKIFVSSQWAKDVISKYNIKTPITVVPLGVDTNIFDHNLNDKVQNKPDAYIFSVIGKWEIRKCHDILLSIFQKAFPNNENFELWINASSDNGYITPEERLQWETMYKNNPLKDKIKVFPQLQTHNDVAKLLSYIDCGVYISRAEGWNLELLETMAMNKPVIASNYSAHTEFCTTDNSYLIDIEETEPAYDGKYFKGQGNWAKIGAKQIDQIVDHLRYAYKNNVKSNPAGLKTAQSLSWINSANKILNCV